MNKPTVEEVKDWISEFGYYLHSHSGDKQLLTFTHESLDSDYPAITVTIKDETKVSFNGGDLKFFFQIVGGPIQYKHPQMQRYIIIFKHYAQVCATNSPF
ncbi:hypothetical protein Molly5_5 [Maribacter phage Molly_5]|uniref:Uncharacterized protein n=1 Tax=Maribacter phage Molly_1 TaxID=2745685 RepID=A0A8E4XXZ3_9CAUD|nr:hypothetical protein M1M29_gp005 [Maribacter phage Molly_1]QQO97733.1 hypothetical protein Molly2_5 [Maribacter phage Molly_2]QQO97933.1 hypothetical protein Molly3_5 [Maribacter phage Molly_3]QQO98133.1 hypothetical protein Molly4_5 [Maribacter phage Molly_4]QQO98333.1 hypothetical protein Molly5_5 [Maribacter phage Molly_5]QQO97533.1 hypothetical protein Molly1_5 [Maribacter phage Molly_1]